MPLIGHATSFAAFPITPYVNMCISVYHVKALKHSSGGEQNCDGPNTLT